MTRRRACEDVETSVFFGGTSGNIIREEVCGKCPVRRECFGDVMAAEVAAGLQRRHGFAAGLAPRQRKVLADLDAWKCPDCGEAWDPLGFVDGHLECDCGAAFTAEMGYSEDHMDAIRVGEFTMSVVRYYRDEGETCH